MKKGQIQAVIGLILLSVFAIFIYILVTKMGTIITAEGDVHICKKTMEKAKTWRGLNEAWTSLDCPYSPITIEQKKFSRPLTL